MIRVLRVNAIISSLYCGFVLDQEQGNVVKQCDVHQEEKKYTLLCTAVNHTHKRETGESFVFVCVRKGFVAVPGSRRVW